MCMIVTYLTFIAFLVLVSVIILSLNKMLSPKKLLWLEKKIPFECGFTPISKFSLPVSMPFFIIGILFLIFDIEITILVPMIIYLKCFSYFHTTLLITFFILVMLGTLTIEWFMGYLGWMY